MMIGWYDAAFPKAEAAKLLKEQHEADRKALQEQVERIQARFAGQRASGQQKQTAAAKPAS